MGPSRLRRGDVVELPKRDLFLPARVWRRIDADHVQVIDTFQHVSIYRDDHLKLSDYKGCWAWQRHPGNDYGLPPKWIPMTSLKRLKKCAGRYYAHFRNAGGRPKNWTKQDQLEALAEREVSIPDTLVTDIVWGEAIDGVERDVSKGAPVSQQLLATKSFIRSSTVQLPAVMILRDTEESEIANQLQDLYKYCVKSFTFDNAPFFPGPR